MRLQFWPSGTIGFVTILFLLASLPFGFGSPSVGNAAQDQGALVAAAYEYGFPLFEEARLSYLFSYDTANPKHVPVNTFGHHRQLADATERTATTPNNDTLYSSAIIDLSAGPVRLDVPDFGDRYFSIAFIDPYTNNFAYLGTRINGGAPGSYLLAGPDWRGPAQEAIRVIRSPYNHMIALVRIVIDGPEDYPAVHHLQDALRLTPASPAPVRIGLVAPLSSDAETFVAVVNQVLHDNPPPPRDAPLLEKLKSVGIGPNAGPLTPGQRKQWHDHIAAARARLLSASKHFATRILGWEYPPADIGDFGTDYRARAETALRGIGANIPSEMTYAVAFADESGANLNGGLDYRLHLPAGTPRRTDSGPSQYMRHREMAGCFSAKTPYSATRSATGRKGWCEIQTAVWTFLSRKLVPAIAAPETGYQYRRMILF